MMIRLINHDTLKKKEKPAGEITVYISSCLAASQDSQKELESVAGKKDIWSTLLSLLPPRLDFREV